MVKITPNNDISCNSFTSVEGIQKNQNHSKIGSKQRKIDENYKDERTVENHDHTNTLAVHEREPPPTGRKNQNRSNRFPSLSKKKSNNSPSRRKKARERAATKGDKKNKIRTSPSGSKSPHDVPMGKNDLYFALDCEMVGVGPHGADSALARVSIVNWDCKIILDTFVKVAVPVTDFRTFVSGVRSEDIESCKAMELKEVRIAVQNILQGKILIGHGLENDLKALNISHPSCDTRDTAGFAPYMREILDSQNMRVMVPKRLKDLAWQELGKRIQVLGDAHSSIEDGISALELYKAARTKWEAFMSEQVKRANDLEISRLQKVANFTKRRVRPAPVYQSFSPKEFHTHSLPLNPNQQMKDQPHAYFIPTQDPRYFLQSQYKHHSLHYSTTEPHQQHFIPHLDWKHYVASN